VLAPAAAEDLDLTGSRRQQALDDFDGRGLAGAVGPEQAEALPFVNQQIKTADRLDRRSAVVALYHVGAPHPPRHSRDYRRRWSASPGMAALRPANEVKLCDAVRLVMHSATCTRRGVTQ